jgi:S-methylmethionine-dependent homocysteine/selenocysteine methylase
MSKLYDLTKEWMDYNPPEVVRELHEIMLADGCVHLMCWPYKNYWYCFSKEETENTLKIPINSNTRFVREADQINWLKVKKAIKE